MASEFLIQVVHKSDGRVVAWAPGLEVEQEFIKNFCDRLKGKGVGIFRTEAKVLAAAQEAMDELLYDLKKQV
jgi:hypothetical protein